jgi:hypothetical protein
MAGYDNWKSREPDPWEFEDKPEETPMDRYDAWKPLLRQIQHAAGLDPDGPRLVPMQARLSREETRRAVRRAGEVADRDAMLRRSLRSLW